MKKYSFTLLESVVVIALIAILSSQITPKIKTNSLLMATNQIQQHLMLTRFFALTDNIYDQNNLAKWHKARWTIKFMRCSAQVGGFYYVIYKDTNTGGMPNKDESLIDPITKKYLYSNNDCIASKNEAKYILLTQEYGIEKISISCNKTTSLGQISFGYYGEPYSSLSDKYNENRLEKDCLIEISDKNNNKARLKVSANTGFASIIE